MNDKTKTHYELKYYSWGKEIKEYYLDRKQAELEAHQHARNSEVFIDNEQVLKNYKY